MASWRQCLLQGHTCCSTRGIAVKPLYLACRLFTTAPERRKAPSLAASRRDPEDFDILDKIATEVAGETDETSAAQSIFPPKENARNSEGGAESSDPVPELDWPPARSRTRRRQASATNTAQQRRERRYRSTQGREEKGVRVTRPVPRLDELPLTEPENGPAPFAPDTQQQAAQAFAETSHADINSPGDPDDISKTKRALQGDAGTPLLPAEPSSASEVGEDARAPALAPMGPEPPAEMESYEGEVVDAPVGAGEEEEWGEGLVEGGEDVGDDGAGDGDDGLARAREEVRERAEALLSIVNAGADFEAELARHMHLMDDLFLDVLDRRIQAAEKYQAKEREVLEGLQLIRKAVVREIERIRSGPALRLLDELLTLLDSAKVLPSDIAQGTQDDVPTEDEALAAATERMRMAFSSPALEAMDIFSLSGALSDVQDGTQALPPDVEKLLSMETVPVDLFITEVRALLNEVKETQKEEERVFQELWDKAGDSEVRLRGLRPYKEQLEGKKETMASVSKLLSIALQFKTASG